MWFDQLAPPSRPKYSNSSPVNSKYLTEVLQPLLGGTEQTFRDSAEFVRIVTREGSSEEEEMISFDVTALYTSQPFDRTTQSVTEHLKMDDTLGFRTPLSVEEMLRLLKICVHSTFFTFRGGIIAKRMAWQ